MLLGQEGRFGIDEAVGQGKSCLDGGEGGLSGFRLVFPDTYRYIRKYFEGTTLHSKIGEFLPATP